MDIFKDKIADRFENCIVLVEIGPNDNSPQEGRHRKRM